MKGNTKEIYDALAPPMFSRCPATPSTDAPPAKGRSLQEQGCATCYPLASRLHPEIMTSFISER
jgi:hypothetical protein